MSNESSKFFLMWSTWLEEEITTPWDFWYVRRGDRFRSRSNKHLIVNADQLAQAFAASNQDFIDNIEKNFTEEIVLMSIIPASDTEEAKTQVKNCFPDAEFHRNQQIDGEAQKKILDLISHIIAGSINPSGPEAV
jgi:hypothetical protein